MDGRDGGLPVDPAGTEQRRPSRADSLRLTRMPQIPRSAPPPGPGRLIQDPQPSVVRPEPPAPHRWGWIAAGIVVLLAVPIVLIGLHRTEEPLPAPAAAAVPTEPEAPATATSAPEPPAPASPGVTPSASPSVTSTASPSATSAPSPSAPKPSVTGKANPSGANLALQGTATASASEGDPWLPANAIDGDPESRWSSGFSDAQWIRVDLGRAWQISEVVLVWERAYGTAYRVETSLDGKTWKRVYATTTGTGGTVRISEQAVARFVRMHGTKRVSIYGYSLLELEIR
ncbi:discoidin domain-containing protein [Actinoplanes subglobosus]|uniref:Discoidin domain-containing protein n=1 Tax=Actinoplanes subglobosus TaxID=1547892 RepID=A0ABV8IZY1_9ACTN